MRELVFGRDREVLDFVQRHFRFELSAGECSTIGLSDKGQLIAGVVYHRYHPEWKNIEMTIAANTARWATKDAIGSFLAFPFYQYGCNRVTACVSRRNKRCLRFLRGIGFKTEGVIRRGYGNHDLIVMGMLKKEAARWIENVTLIQAKETK